jgi:hypothetical protein
MGSNAQILIALISGLCLAGCSDEYSVSGIVYDATGWDIFEPDNIRLTCPTTYITVNFDLIHGHDSIDPETGNTIKWSKNLIQIFSNFPIETNNNYVAEIDRRTLEIEYWNWSPTLGKINRYNWGECSLVDLTPKI